MHALTVSAALSVASHSQSHELHKYAEVRAYKNAQFLLRHTACKGGYDYIDSGRGTGIALLNVNNRIRLLFGEQYGITICSTPGLGTDVTVTLPAKHEGRA